MNQRNVAASVRARLLNKARSEKLDFNLLLTRYALERVLYRLSISEQRGQFLLKGALLFDIWFDVPHRPTHDADLLGSAPPKSRTWKSCSRGQPDRVGWHRVSERYGEGCRNRKEAS